MRTLFVSIFFSTSLFCMQLVRKQPASEIIELTAQELVALLRTTYQPDHPEKLYELITDDPTLNDFLKERIALAIAHGATPLHIAISLGSREAVQLFFASGTSIEEIDQLGNTALHHAAAFDRMEIAELLITLHNADVEARNRSANTPLHEALTSCSTNTVMLLLRLHANVNVSGHLNRTPLHLAAQRNQIKIVELLLGMYADVNTQDGDGRTALHHAVDPRSPGRRGFPLLALVRLLIVNGAPLDATDLEGQSALHLAVKYGYIEIVRALIEAGASLCETNHQSQTPLALAKNPEIIQLLKERLGETKKSTCTII